MLLLHTTNHKHFSLNNDRFIYSVATGIPGAKLSANMCSSLLVHGISTCAMVGYASDAVQWWIDNKEVLPSNAVIYDATHQFQWVFDWNQREHSRTGLESYFVSENVTWENYLRIQAVVLARTFLFIDMLHHGTNVWMLDSDVVFPLDPKGMFLDPSKDCVYMMNIGSFNEVVRYEIPYSYPFLTDGRHATINNGIVASRSTPSALKLWEKSMDCVLNHASGDPQHPHNLLLYLLGLRVEKVPVDGYPSLDGDFGYYEGTAVLYVHESETLPLEVRAVSALSAYDNFGADQMEQHTSIHAVGVGGMSHSQGTKCEYLKRIGMWWHRETSCE